MKKYGDGISVIELSEEPPKDSNIAVEIASELLSGDLSGNKWKSYNLNQLNELIYDSIYRRGVQNDRHILIMLRKITKCKNETEFLTMLSEVVLSIV